MQTLGPDGSAASADIVEDLDALLALPSDQRPDIVNLSLGGYTVSGQPPTELSMAIARFGRTAPETVIIAAAGNDGDSRPMYPAACPGVIGVAASDGAGAPMPWSNHGAFIDVCMDGNEIVSDYFTGRVRFDDGTSDRFSGSTVWSGTSFAAPKLAGRIAAVMTRQPARHRSARVAMQQLYTSALPVFTLTGRQEVRFYGRWVRG